MDEINMKLSAKIITKIMGNDKSSIAECPYVMNCNGNGTNVWRRWKLVKNIIVISDLCVMTEQ